MDAAAQIAIMKLIIAWLFIGVIVFTTFLTCLSLYKKRVFVDKYQQRWLFHILIIELITGAVALFFGFVNPNPNAAKKEITKPIEEENIKLNGDVMLLLNQRNNILRDNLAAQTALFNFQINSKEPMTVEQNLNRQKALDELRRRIEFLQKQLAEQEKRNPASLLYR